MSLINVPTAENFYKKAESLYFEAFTSLLNNIFFKIDHEFSQHITPVESNNIINMFHQSCELYLKGKVTETSPFLLINNLKSHDFLKCFTLDASILQDVLHKTNPKFINEHMSDLFEKYRKLRNEDTHSYSSINISDDQYEEYFFDFIDVYNLFNTQNFTSQLSKFLNLKYDKNMLNTGRNKFITSNNYRSKYISLITSFIKNIKLEKKYEKINIEYISKNKKIFKLLNLNNSVNIDNERLFCLDCKPDFYINFGQVDLEEIIEFNDANVKTVIKHDNYFKCFCCEQIYEKNLIIYKTCKICSSIEKTNKNTEHFNDICMCCNIQLHKKYKKYLKYGYRYSNNIPPLIEFYQNLEENFDTKDGMKNYIDEILNVMYGVHDINLLFGYTLKPLPTNLIAGSCTDYSLFYEMYLEKDNSTEFFYLRESDKSKIYNNHKNIFSIKETVEFAFTKYKHYIEELFLNGTVFKENHKVNRLLNMFHDKTWIFIFSRIHDYYGITIDDSNFVPLMTKYFGSNILLHNDMLFNKIIITDYNQ